MLSGWGGGPKEKSLGLESMFSKELVDPGLIQLFFNS